MPDDLLRFVDGPTGLGWAWLVPPIVLTMLLVGWYVAVIAMTADRGSRVVQQARDVLARRRFLAVVRRTRARLAGGEIDAATAGAELNRTLRGFLQRATGTPVEFMPVNAIAESGIASTAALFARLDDARFNTRTQEDVDALGAAAEEVIASWT